MGADDLANGAGWHVGSRSHGRRERDLVAGSGRDVDAGDEPAGGDVDEIGARLVCPRAHLNGVVDGPAGRLRPVGGGEAHEDRHTLAGLGAHRANHVEQQPSPVLERSAPLVRALVAERGEELMQQVAVRGVHLEHIETGVEREPRRGRPRAGEVRDLVGGELARARRSR